jgi:hypothetical protein
VKYSVKCKTPYCSNIVLLGIKPKYKDYVFCDQCKREHSLSVLQVQADLKMPIREALLEARIFRTANLIGDFMGVSFVTIYNWVKKYYGMSFQEFRRTYICRSKKCYLLNIERSSYSRSDYALKKIRSQRYCACINALEKNFIMTNAPVSVVSQIFRGAPKIVKVSDSVFSLAPQPVNFLKVFPIYFDSPFKIPKHSSV